MFRSMFRPIAPYVVICFVPRFVPWPHAHDPISRHVATTPFITNGRIQAVLRGDSRPGSAERTAGPEAIGCPDPGNRAQRRSVVRARATGLRGRLVVRARSDDGFGSDSQSGSDHALVGRFSTSLSARRARHSTTADTGCPRTSFPARGSSRRFEI